ncbi:hypothetical protein AS361_04915 [Myroides marinus]|uniref:DUF6520 family protein n=1 Tax=Myroides marinus TaxID=703342 RepID=UPI000741C57D|nr:DUF6520 family protein [Myroides marinus]KUF46478.1 hypothetical protein AS361_04915 [Myroides marinus]
MKRFLKSAGLPIGVFALAIGSAFATNAMKSSQLSVPAYQKIDSNGLVCTPREATCDIEGAVTCTWAEGSTMHNLYGLQEDPISKETVCTLPLFKIQTP